MKVECRRLGWMMELEGLELLMGELFQNNHHYAKDDANFAKKWFEFDLTFFVMRGLNAVGIIRLIPAVLPVAALVPVNAEPAIHG